MKLYLVVSEKSGRRPVYTSMIATDDTAAIKRINLRFPESDGWNHVATEKDSVILDCSEDRGA